MGGLSGVGGLWGGMREFGGADEEVLGGLSGFGGLWGGDEGVLGGAEWG